MALDAVRGVPLLCFIYKFILIRYTFVRMPIHTMSSGYDYFC